jgi:hypothetical protein
MPGAPNRPPETVPDAPPPPPPGLDGAARKALRRLVPSRVALKLDLWKGTVAADLFAPFDRADKAYQAGDYVNAESGLDQLAVRFAEPRWPTLPGAFRELRVSIPQPQPPSWDPEFSLPAPERDAKKMRRYADTQVALLGASLDWATGKGIDVTDLAPALSGAKETLAREGATEPFWALVDQAWTGLAPRVPAPVPVAPRVAPVATAEAADVDMA